AREIRVGIGDFEFHFAADEFKVCVAHQHAGKKARFAKNLEAVADAKHPHTFFSCLCNSGHDAAPRSDGAGAEIVAIGKAAAQHDEIEIGKVRICMPDGGGFDAGDLFEGAHHVALAVRAGKDNDAGLHAHFSSSSTA